MCRICCPNVDHARALGERVSPEIDGLPTLLVPVGSTEQHGPHLPLDTDARVAAAVAARTAAGTDLLVAPAVAYGASGEHEGFPGTVSIGQEALRSLVVELGRSAGRWAGRLVFVNGHGGNIGVCHAAAAAASTRYDVRVAHVDYWRLVRDCGDVPVPGHAGEFETGLMLAQDEEFVAERNERRDPPSGPAVHDVSLHTTESWQRIDGYTDRPELADPATGRKWFDQVAAALGDRLLELAEVL
jgi:creatinine amidohydrolase